MPGAFWTSWELWEKLCFILGAAIVIVIFLGVVKLTYNHWKLRKYTKVAASKAALKREMQHSRSVRRGRAKGVPFGIRALESGVEVEGVWISKTNTPASSLPGSPILSAITVKPNVLQPESAADRTSSVSNMTHLEIPQRHPEVNAAAGSSAIARSPFDRPSRKHEPPPTSDHQARGRPTYQPRRASGLRYSNSHTSEESESSIDGGKPSREKGTTRHRGSESDEARPSASWSRSSAASGPGSSSQPRQSNASSNDFLRPEYRQQPAAHTVDRYELTGLSPHVVNPDHDMNINESHRVNKGKSPNDWAALYDSVGDGNATGARQPFHTAGDPFATPTESLFDGRGPSFESDGKNDITDQHTQLMQDNEITYDEGHAQPLRRSDGNGDLRQSQIIRKVNSGFQILRPGTLDDPDQGDEIVGSKDGERSDKRVSRKLQKRGRASSTSSYTLEKQQT